MNFPMIKKKPYIFVWVFLISSWILNASSFRFSPPEVIKASWNARTFISEDLNNLKFNANLSFIKSELTMSDDEFDSRTLAARDGETCRKAHIWARFGISHY